MLMSHNFVSCVRCLDLNPNMCVCYRGVRRAVHFCGCMVLLALPTHSLVTDLQTQVLDLNTWLQGGLSIIFYAFSLLYIYIFFFLFFFFWGGGIQGILKIKLYV